MERIERYLQEMTLLPGLSGFEQKVAAYMKNGFESLGLPVVIDTLGNCIAKVEGRDPAAPTIMVFAHMDSVGFLVRRIEDDGFLRFERLGGSSEKALPATQIQVQCRDGSMVDGVIGIKAHHVTPMEEKYVADKYTKLFVDIGASSREEVLKLGITVGSPILYKPRYQKLLGSRALMSSADNRSGCAVLLEVANRLVAHQPECTTYIVGSVQEEYNQRGAMVACRTVKPDAAICIDGATASDTPDLKGFGELCLGKGPVMTLYNFHGRGTLNGTIAHPAMVRIVEKAAEELQMNLQRNVCIGLLTDLSYVQLERTGVACIDLCVPRRYTHSACEILDIRDVQNCANLVAACVGSIRKDTDFSH